MIKLLNDDYERIRMAKGKLPKEIQKKVDEWKFSSRALVMCLVAYSDGNGVQAFQYVHSFLPMVYA